jgi:hypothetical protein
MSWRKAIAAVVVCAAWTTMARAADPVKRTQFSTNEPFEVPGMVLEPGRYVFRLIEPEAQRNVLEVFETVQLWTSDEARLLSTLLTMPNYDMPTTDKTVFAFFERGPKQAKALRLWFAPGRNYGQEFVYPKAQAVELAKAVGRGVLSMPPELPADIGRLARMVVEPGPAAARAPIAAVTPEPHPEAVAPPARNAVPPSVPAAPAPAASQMASSAAVRTAQPATEVRNIVPAAPVESRSRASEPKLIAASLPRTASYLPVLAMLGILGTGGGAALRVLALRLERR